MMRTLWSYRRKKFFQRKKSGHFNSARGAKPESRDCKNRNVLNNNTPEAPKEYFKTPQSQSTLTNSII